MLSPDDRALYSQCLEAPLGYRFDYGVATTFTLNLETLLVLPFTLATNRGEDPTTLLEDPVALLEALRSTTDRLTVFHHAGYIHVPPREQLLFGLLEDCVVPALPPEGGIFHPKLWLLRFLHVDDETPLLRAVVLSRNLTFDRSWDTALCLEGTPTGRRVRDSYGLRDCVASLTDLAHLPLSHARQAHIEELAEACAHTRFAPPEPFRPPVRFHSIGTGRRFEPKVEGYPKRVLCVSPFLSPRALSRAARRSDDFDVEHILISRDQELDRLPSEALADWDCRVIADAVEAGETSDDAPSDDAPRSNAPIRGLHAKMFAIEDYQRRVTWWLGSANLTSAAWEGRNVELMVELSGTAKHAGIGRFLESGFERLLVPWSRSEADEEAGREEAALALAEKVRDSMIRGPLRLRCQGAGDAWTLGLDGSPDLPAGVVGRAWPITLAEKSSSKPFADADWGPIAPASLTSVIAFALTATHDGVDASLRFALQLEHDPFPPDRHAHIVRQIVSSRRGFFRYLRVLLAASNGELAVLGLAQALRTQSQGRETTPRSQASFLEEVVLEELLRALSRDPGRLDAVGRLVDDLTQTEEGRALVPEDFLELWSVIARARGRR